MARLSDKEQFLQHFRQEANGCVRLISSDTTDGDVPDHVLSRFERMHRDLRHAHQGQLFDDDEYAALSLPLNALIFHVRRRSDQIRTGKTFVCLV